MWGGVCFAVMLLVVGVPLWWKTTEVERASLPFDSINSLTPSNICLALNLSVYSEYPTTTNHIIDHIHQYFQNTKLYSVTAKPYKLDLDKVSVEGVEAASEVHPTTPGHLLLIQVETIPQPGINILLSNRRIIYFTRDAKLNKLCDVISEWLLSESELEERMLSMVEPGLSSHSQETLYRRLRAALGYDIIFTVINSDPENVNLIWDVQAAIRSYIEPVLEQIREVGEHRAKSQWLYMTELGETPTFFNDKYILSYKQLPHIITPLEKKLGSGISKWSCVHLVLYTSSCRWSPLKLVSEEGLEVDGMVSPQWGAIQVLNPGPSHCLNHSLLSPPSHQLMSLFTSQLHYLLGITPMGKMKGVDVLERKGGLLRDWELDLLYRIRTVDQITSASLTLQSLSKLLGEISNIVINAEVASCVEEAVQCVRGALEELGRARLQEALRLSAKAFHMAETAFSNPSLLSLLYFPDDQKYAVYIPLFLPIMIPVLMSLKNIYNWMFNRQHEKVE